MKYYEICKRSHEEIMCSSEFLKQCVTIGVLSMNDDMECEKNYSKIQAHTKYKWLKYTLTQAH